MRILGIRFMNINSLAGEWSVDFTDPSYTGDGIFAITGPTGAGKTTLLDVICLALYGRTPRLDRINKSGNDIMTRQTGECFAEVTFSTVEGNFRCYWYQHRARRKADGDLQAPRHEISNADTGQIIDNQIRSVGKRIETITGMDFTRFTQSMMLAQGNFAAFLKASEEQRSEILEQITGTQIYSTISVAVHERLRHENTILGSLEAELRGLVLLTPEQEQELAAEEQRRSEELASLTQELQRRQQIFEWKRRCLDQEKRLAELQTEHQQWQLQDTDFEPQRVRLASAQRALELSADYRALISLRQLQQNDRQTLERSNNQLPALQQQLNQLHDHHIQAQDAYNTLQTKLAEQRPVWRQVVSLDSTIVQQKKALSELNARRASLLQQQQSWQQKKQAVLDEFNSTRQMLDHLRTTADETDEALSARHEELRLHKQQTLEAQQQLLQTLSEGLTLKQWHTKLQQTDEKLRLLDRISDLVLQQQSLDQLKHSLTADSTALAQDLQQIESDIRQQQNLFSAREQALDALRQQLTLQKTVLNYEQQRKQLNDGDPCPLCGATEHPWAVHEPDLDINQTQQQINAAETSCKQTQQQLQQKLAQKSQLQERHAQLLLRSEKAEQDIKQAQQGIQQLSQQAGLDAVENLLTYRESVTANKDSVQKTLDTLEAEQQKCSVLDIEARTASEQFAALQQKISSLQHLQIQLKTVDESVRQLQTELDKTQSELQTRNSQLTALQQQRQQLMGDLDPVEQEKLFEGRVSQAQQQLEGARQQYQTVERRLQELQRTIAQLQQQISDRGTALQQTEQNFTAALLQKQFSSEQDYLAAVLPDKVRQDLNNTALQLKEKGAGLKALQQQTAAELEKLRSQGLSEESLETLASQLEEQQTRANQQRELLGGIRRELENNRLARSRQGDQAARIDAQKAEVTRWAALHELIGSSDGKKFRNFAQGLTFELMIQHANVQLGKMTDRYLLVRDREQPLDLNVIDQYQAGEIRSTRNLSGGESFIVSLALALGLSAMASRKVRVDSLFLDEGFGTLDEDALDVALDTLGNLQQQGKLIGVISHVSALKERISTRINVMPGPGGRSRLSGPGCQSH